MVAYAAPHALLVVNWAEAGAALLSVPTREYFQVWLPFPESHLTDLLYDRRAVGLKAKLRDEQGRVISTNTTIRGQRGLGRIPDLVRRLHALPPILRLG